MKAKFTVFTIVKQLAQLRGELSLSRKILLITFFTIVFVPSIKLFHPTKFSESDLHIQFVASSARLPRYNRSRMVSQMRKHLESIEL